MIAAQKNPKPWVEGKTCECGCGKLVNKYSRYISGHNSNIALYANDPIRKEKAAIAMKGRTFSEEGRAKIKAIRQRDNIRPEYRQKMSKIVSKLWKSEEFTSKMADAHSFRPNKVELKLKEILDYWYEGEWKYTGDFTFWINGKNPDFVNCNGQKLIIEMFGDYWHRNDDPNARISHFAEFGYRTLVIWENELHNSNLDSTITKIIRFCENGKEVKK